MAQLLVATIQVRNYIPPTRIQSHEIYIKCYYGTLFCCDRSWWIQVNHLPISFRVMNFRVTSLVLGQSFDCPSTSEVTLKDMGKLTYTKTQQSSSIVQYSWEGTLFFSHDNMTWKLFSNYWAFKRGILWSLLSLPSQTVQSCGGLMFSL